MKMQVKLWHVLTGQILFLASLVWAADSRITDLTELTAGNLAAADVLEVVDVSTTTDNAAGSSRKVQLSTLKDFIEGQFIALAGSSTAGSWLKLQSGTLQTTPDEDSIENDGNVFYGTTDAGNRGYIPVRHCIRANATRTLPNDTNENAIFASPANGRLTLEAGTYLFDGMLTVSSMSATSGNAAIDLLGAGTAVANDWLWQAVGSDGGTGSTATMAGSHAVAQQSPASVVSAGTSTVLTASMRGTFTVTTAGTMIPSITLVTASAAVVGIGSYVCLERIGDPAMESVGQWD